MLVSAKKVDKIQVYMYTGTGITDEVYEHYFMFRFTPKRQKYQIR